MRVAVLSQYCTCAFFFMFVGAISNVIVLSFVGPRGVLNNQRKLGIEDVSPETCSHQPMGWMGAPVKDVPVRKKVKSIVGDGLRR